MRFLYRYLRILSLLLPITPGCAQVTFHAMRYNDDFTWMAADTNRHWYRSLKYIPVRPTQSYVSLGGEVKYQYFTVRNGLWGYLPKDSDGYVLTKILLHTDFHISQSLRVFLQLQGNGANGKNTIIRGEVNPLDLHQGFIDYNAGIGHSTRLTLRMGRQELSYGAQRLISVHDLPNNRQAFDAVKLMIDGKTVTFHFLYGYYVIPEDGNFDDTFSTQTKLYGLYNTFTAMGINGDLYILGYDNRHATYHQVSGNEFRTTLGGRLHGNIGGWRFDAEGSYQHGNVEKWTINAWMVSANVSYRWNHQRLRPALGMKAEIISGDKFKEDTRIETFNPLFPRGSYYGLANIIGPANIIDLHPSFELGYRKTLFSLDYDLFWRENINDGLYTATMIPLFEGKKSNQRFIAQQITAELEWDPIPYFEFKFEYTYSNSGRYLEGIGLKKNIHFAAVTLGAKF